MQSVSQRDRMVVQHERPMSPGPSKFYFSSKFSGSRHIENTIHRLGAWLRLNKKTILASVQHQDQRMGRTARPSQRRSNRAAPTHRTTASLPRCRQLTLHAALEQSIINQRNAQDPVLAAVLQMEAQDVSSASSDSSTTADTESSYLSSSDESSQDDDSSEGQERYGEFDRSHRNSRPKVKMKNIHSCSFSTLS
jgi:hypothetical protein